ncbi:hypothetical protein [Belliella pelovolcani]|uniref:Lipoprotein n=1 Tax=Belliella pelovolcani TaxID=529505 RepID=A0A1N7NWI4_9BACT|nr:hypothetical protein [Belliella pelovolcani]SIT02680.1 hypothetical protein SAMN05421761_11233 [Belliella pelovolcani]
MKIGLGLILLMFAFSCNTKEENLSEPKLIIKLVLDENQERLGNNGLPSQLPAGHAGQNPKFNGLSAHYLELAQGSFTPLGNGEIIYHAPETNVGGSSAIDFEKSIITKSGETFLEIPLKGLTPGQYEWVRLSLSYQNYDVDFYFNDQPFRGTVASFVGFNNYIKAFQVKNQAVTVNSNKRQGFWAFETINGVLTGESPEGATTVPNPLFQTSPIPPGSCVVTGKFDQKLIINGNEKKDIEMTMSLSINKSFEWVDQNGNGKWDVDPGAMESIVDMGLRGLVPKWKILD